MIAAQVVGVLAADAPPADTASQGPVIVVVLAIVTMLGTGLTAAGPVLLEMVKNRGKPTPAPASPGAPASPSAPPEPTPASSQMVETANSGLSMLEVAVQDYRAQRDAAQRRYELVLDELTERDNIIRDQAVTIARLEARFGGPQNYQGRHSSYPQNRNLS